MDPCWLSDSWSLVFSVDVFVFGIVFCAVVIRDGIGSDRFKPPPSPEKPDEVTSLFGTVFEIRCGRFSCDFVFAIVPFDCAYFFELISNN